MVKRYVFLLVFLSLIFSFSSPLKAANFTVTKTADTADGACDADCSLREAIIAANAAAGADTITVPAGVYTLTRTGWNEGASLTGDLNIRDSVTINGAGADATIIQGSTGESSGSDRVFDLVQTVTPAITTLSGVTVRYGYSSYRDGGGIYVGSTSTLNLNNSIVASSYSSYYGGGIYNAGTTIITGSTLYGNSATYGGGIANMNSGGLTIRNSTLYGNNSYTNGGAIYNLTSKSLTILNSTIYANTSDAIGSGSPGTAGIFRGTGTAVIRNSIVSKNTNATNPNSDCTGSMTVENSLGCGGTIVTGADTVLGNNSGPTPTVALFSGSNAIDAGDDATCETIDQRGQIRPFDGDGNGTATCDIGAFEANTTLTPPRITLNSVTLAEGDSGTSTITFTLNRFGDTSGVSSVQYATSNGTATAGSDYVAIPPTALTFDVNEVVKTIEVTVNGDIAPEANETFTLNLSSPTNVVIRDPQGIGTLTNDDNSATVSKTDDTNDGMCDADCSLREAVSAANAAPGTQTIYLPAGVYTLTITGLNEYSNATGDLDSWENLIITGAGAETTIIQAGTTASNGIDRVFDVMNSNLSMSGVTVRYGRVTSITEGGGGINAVSGSVTLTNSIVTVNYSGFAGGGIRATGTITLTNVLVSENSSLQSGGIHANGQLIITGSTITNNTATGTGGGIYSSNSLTLTNSTISNNYADTVAGLYNSGTGTISGSTFSGNIAIGIGGGLFNYNTLTVKNSTFSGNSASEGGGIYAAQSTLTVNNSTFVGNSATTSGGGIYRSTNAGTVTVRNTIIANSTNGDCAGTTISLQNSLGCGATTATGLDLNLSNNGGPTLTHALQVGSNAINGGNNATCETTDQRGNPRPVGNACDIGAYEYHPETIDLSVSLIGTTYPVLVDSSTPYILTISNTGSLNADDVTLTIDLPNGITGVSYSATQGVCDIQVENITCDLGTISSSGNASVDLTAQYVLAGDYLLVANVMGSSADQNPADNAATIITQVIANDLPNASPSVNFSLSPIVRFSWNRVSWSQGYEVEIATEMSFDNPVYTSGQLSTDTLSVEHSLSNGVYYWRVGAITSTGATVWSAPTKVIVRALNE